MARWGALGRGISGLGQPAGGVTGRHGACRGVVVGAGVCGDAACAGGLCCQARGGRGERRAGHLNLGLQNGHAQCTLSGNRRQVPHLAAGGERVWAGVVDGRRWFVVRGEGGCGGLGGVGQAGAGGDGRWR